QRETYQTLRGALADSPHTELHHMDGFLGLKALLPPKERRGLILIDPPYEDFHEFSHLARILPATLKKWEQGVYAIWFPIKDGRQIERFYTELKQSIARPMLAISLCIYNELPQHLNGAGIVVINPPWQFDASVQS